MPIRNAYIIGDSNKGDTEMTLILKALAFMTAGILGAGLGTVLGVTSFALVMAIARLA